MYQWMCWHQNVNVLTFQKTKPHRLTHVLSLSPIFYYLSEVVSLCKQHDSIILLLLKFPLQSVKISTTKHRFPQFVVISLMFYILYVFTLRFTFHLFFLYLATYHTLYRKDETLIPQLPTWKGRPLFPAAPSYESPSFVLAHFAGCLLTSAKTQYKFLSSGHQSPVLKRKKRGFLSSVCPAVISTKLQEGKSDRIQSDTVCYSNTISQHPTSRQLNLVEREVTVMLSSQVQLVLLSKDLAKPG